MELNDCLHCGGAAEYVTENAGSTVWARCGRCGVRTQPVAADIGYAARERAAGVWNAVAPSQWPAWAQPSGAADAYALDARVSHGGKYWQSLVAANVWEPGVANWREVRP